MLVPRYKQTKLDRKVEGNGDDLMGRGEEANNLSLFVSWRYDRLGIVSEDRRQRCMPDGIC